MTDRRTAKINTDCTICFEFLRFPYIFNCAHGVCIKCTAELLQHDQRCPVCRTAITSAMPNHALSEVLGLDDDLTDEDRTYQVIISSNFDDFTPSTQSSASNSNNFSNFNMQSLAGSLPVVNSSAVQRAQHALTSLVQRTTGQTSSTMAASVATSSSSPTQTLVTPSARRGIAVSSASASSVTLSSLSQPAQPTAVQSAVQSPIQSQIQSAVQSPEQSEFLTAAYNYVVANARHPSGCKQNSIGAWLYQYRHVSWMSGYALLVILSNLTTVSGDVKRSLKAKSKSEVESRCRFELNQPMPEGITRKQVGDWLWADMLARRVATPSTSTSAAAEVNQAGQAGQAGQGENERYTYTAELVAWLDFNFMKWLVRSYRVNKSSRKSLETSLLTMSFNRKDVFDDE